jgi:DNA-binding NarL/FixJ family response regulator
MALKKEQAQPDKRKAQILIVDDHPIVREGLETMLNHEQDLHVCGQADDAPHALQAIAELNPDVAIVDISLKNSDGIELTKTIKAKYPGLFVIVLSVHDESVYAERVLLAGAQGYLMKDAIPENIVKAIRMVLRGEIYVSDAVAKKFLHIIAGDKAGITKTAIESLSDREFETFRLIGQGYKASQIALQLHLSVKTIETYRSRIKGKLGLANAAQLLQYSIAWARNRSE